MFNPRSTSKVFMQPGAVMGETNGLYAAVLVNNNPTRLLNPVAPGAVKSGVASIRRFRAPSALGWK